MKNKNDAVVDAVANFKKSWTYNRLSEHEKRQFSEAFSEPFINDISGDYKQRYKQLNCMYWAFLCGVGYDNSIDWRGK